MPVLKTLMQFQSSPTPKGGRYAGNLRDNVGNVAFQSSPTPKGGRYHGHRRTDLQSLVSILTHPEGWALHALILLVLRFAYRFNPHPPRRVGATISPDTRCIRAPVSILTHPEGWALLPLPVYRSRCRSVSILTHPEGWALPGTRNRSSRYQWFQSSPTPKGGRYAVADCESDAFDGFQSSPTPKGGRYASMLFIRGTVNRFNPHPPRRVGATQLRPAYY